VLNLAGLDFYRQFRTRLSSTLSRSSLFLMPHREYQYVGPPAILEVSRVQPSGTAIRSVNDLTQWLSTGPTEQTPDGNWIATFTLGKDLVLRVAPRRSEHVACAAGGPVLSAGEITISEEYDIPEISNQSTGFCPEPESWVAVEAVLNDAGIEHPGEFTTSVTFRLCPKCRERNIVKDSWFFCQLCDAKLPEDWNFNLGQQSAG